ncbi:MOSC domain-containing protein [Acetobacterium woodii]|nr:MOSC domain-containing protein [Acetobacterium woodii]
MACRGKITGICTSVDTGTSKRNVHQANVIKNYGVEGDAHAGFHTDKQVSLLSYEKIQAFIGNEATVKEGAFGENLVVQGLDWSLFPIGTQFRSGDVILEITHRGTDCDSCEMCLPRTECLIKKDGLFCKVIMGGIITEGDYLHVEN